MAQVAPNGLYQTTYDDLTAYRIQAFEDDPCLSHAIFTRHGGVSHQPFAALNLGASVGDDPEAVAENFRRACRMLAIRPEQTVACHLFHSAEVITVTRVNRQRVMGKADGLISAEPDIYLAMRFGDCTPLIFFDPVRRAVGLTHAGWRGTMKNAAGATVKEMTQQLGCRPQDIIAVIGPAIGPCCYEVGSDVMEAARQSFGQADNLFSRQNGRSDRAYFDMWAANHRQLAASGVGQIIRSGLCTACRTDLFYSHRAEKGRTGRFGVIIGLRGETG
jgi:YfiH family protein